MHRYWDMEYWRKRRGRTGWFPWPLLMDKTEFSVKFKLFYFYELTFILRRDTPHDDHHSTDLRWGMNENSECEYNDEENKFYIATSSITRRWRCSEGFWKLWERTLFWRSNKKCHQISIYHLSIHNWKMSPVSLSLWKSYSQYGTLKSRCFHHCHILDCSLWHHTDSSNWMSCKAAETRSCLRN